MWNILTFLPGWLAGPGAPTRTSPDPYLHALVLPHHSCQLEVAFHLLSNLLEAIHDGNGGDGVDAAQDVQRHINEALLPGNLPVLDDGGG